MKFISTLPNIGLDKRKTLLNRIEVWRIQWKVDRLNPTGREELKSVKALLLNRIVLPFFTSLFYTFNMMNAAVVKNQNTMACRIRIHDT